MAQSANAAYMLWRQFSGEAKPGASMNLQGPRAQSQMSPDVTRGTSDVDAIRQFASTMEGFMNDQQKKHKEEVDPKVKAWMSQHTMEEYQQKMREGNVPFQNDKVAMDILHNQSAYNVALQVEEAIQNKVKEGKFKTVEEAEQARIEALNGARGEYVLSMGISADSKAFNTGFDRDADKRRALLVSLQTDVTDKNLRTQAKIQTQADLLAPLTPDFVRAAPGQVTAQYIGNTIKRAETLGQIRGDADKLEVYNSAMQALQGMPGGASAIQALGEQEVSLFGVKASMRTHLGGGVFDQAVLKSRQMEQQQDSQRQGALSATLMTMQNKLDMNGLMGLRKNLEAESGGKMTSDIQAVDQTIEYTNRKIQQENATLAAKLAKEQEADMQLFVGIQGLNKLISGDGLVSPDGKDLGFKDEAQARQGEERLLNSISDPAEKLQTAMKLAAVRKDGFAANALKTWGSQADAQWGQFQQRLERGEQGLKVPEQVTRMANLYQQNPEAYTMMFGKALYGSEKSTEQGYIAAIEAASQIGASMEDIAKSQVEWKKLPKDVKKAAEDALARQVNKTTSQDPAYVEQSIRMLASPMITMGVAPETAVQMARESFDKQHEKINGYPIHRGFFQVTGDRESYSAGVKSFQEIMPKVREQIGKPSESNVGFWYDGTNQTVVAFNTKTWEMSQPITRGELQAHAQSRAQAEALKTEKRVRETVQEENKKRVQKKAREDRGIFPYNRPEKNIYEGAGFTSDEIKGAAKGARDAVVYGAEEHRKSSRKVRDEQFDK